MIKWSNREKQVLGHLRIGGDIGDAYRKQPGLRARFGFMAARAKAEVARLKEQRDLIAADIYGEAAKKIRRRKGEAIGSEEEGRAYKWEIEREVKRAPQMLRAVRALRRARLDEDILKAACTSLDHRKEMLISLGADHRAELGSHITMLSNEAKDRLGHRRRKADDDG